MQMVLIKKLKLVLKWILLIMITFLSISPVIWMVISSLKTRGEMFRNIPTIIPLNPTLENYKTILFGGESRLPFLMNSLLISFMVMIVVMIIAAPAGFGFARMKVKGSRHFEFWILSTRMMPPIAALIPIALIINKVGLFDNKIGIILIYIAFNLPYAVWMLTIFFRQLPIEIEEAATLDGCTSRQVFQKVAIPLIVPSLMTVAIFVFVFSWNELMFALILTGRAAKTLPVAISEYAGGVFIRWELMAAASTIQIIPAVLVVVFMQKYIISGLTLGAIEK